MSDRVGALARAIAGAPARERRAALEFDESQHPRDPDGRFGSGDGESTSSPVAPAASAETIASFDAAAHDTQPWEYVQQMNEDKADAWYAIDTYIRPGGEINAGLRSGDLSGTIENPYTGNPDTIGKLVADMNSVAQPAPQDSVFYRGFAVPADFSLEQGAVLTDKGFTSVSLDRSVAQLFAEGRTSGSVSGNTVQVTGERAVVAEVLVPKGTLGVGGDNSVREQVLSAGGSYQVAGTRSDGTLLLQRLAA